MKCINSQSDINVSRVLRHIWQKDSISRVEIASQLGLDKSTVTKIVSALLEVGIVTESAHGNTGPQGGRKPIYLEITDMFAAVGGVEINSNGYMCCLLNLSGKILFKSEIGLQASSATASTRDCLALFEEAFEHLKNEAARLNIQIIGVGVGVSGIVNSDSGVIMQSIPLEIVSHFPFSQLASVIAGVPVFIENDARCCCYSERTLLHDTGQQNSLFLLIEIRKKNNTRVKANQVSVGMGLVINGKIFKGSEFSAGEFRSLLWSGGQTEQFLAKEENLAELGNLSQNDNFKAGQANLDAKNDPKNESIFQEFARHVAFLVNTLNLETVYIGGIGAEVEESLAKMIHERILYQWPYDNSIECEIKLSSLGQWAVAYGAAGMFIDRFFALPSLSSPSGSGPSILESLTQMGTTGLAGKLV